jgi:hypothetical protein
MSIKVMTRVWEHSQHGGGTLLVLLALADYANDNGICWPDVATLATKARLTDRQVSNVLNDLIRDGDLAMVAGRGRGKHSTYAVLVGLDDAQQEKVKSFLRNNFGEIKTLKNDANKRGNSQQEKGKFDVFPKVDSAQREASNPDPIRHEPSENRQRESKTTPPPPVYLHPAVVCYTNLTGRTPNRTTAEMIAAQVKDTAKWEKEINRWLASDFKPGNVIGMLDWYHGKGKHQVSVSAPHVPTYDVSTDTRTELSAEQRRAIMTRPRKDT